MPSGAKPGMRRGGGRIKGQNDKLQLSREIARAKVALGISDAMAAKDVLVRVMSYFIENAEEADRIFRATPRPVYRGHTAARREARIAFEELENKAIRYMRLAAETADRLIGYQMPKLAQTTHVQADPYEHMTDDELQTELIKRAKEAGIKLPLN